VNKKGGDGCWWWDGTVRSDGYGSFGYTVDRKLTNALPHRFSFNLHNPSVEIPKGSRILQTCTNKLCVNPAHLILSEPGPEVETCARGLRKSGDPEITSLLKRLKEHRQTRRG
jgi:hypothetical protein